MARGICEGLREFDAHGSDVHSFRRGHSCDSTPEVRFDRASDGSDHSPRLCTPCRHRPPCPPPRPPISQRSRDRPPPNAFRAGWRSMPVAWYRFRRDAAGHVIRSGHEACTDHGPPGQLGTRDNWTPGGRTPGRQGGRGMPARPGRPGRELRAKSEQWDSYSRSALSNSPAVRAFSHFRALSYTSSTVRESE